MVQQQNNNEVAIDSVFYLAINFFDVNTSSVKSFICNPTAAETWFLVTAVWPILIFLECGKKENDLYFLHKK